MDPFELLLLASKLNDNNNINNVNYSEVVNNQVTLPFDYRNHIHETLLDPMDSIMLLADQACQKSPVKSKSSMKRGFDAPFSPMNSFSNKTSNEPLTPTPTARRVRAMSESFVKQESWSNDRFPYHIDKQATSTSISLRRRKGMDHNLEFSHNERDNEIVNEAFTLPHMLNQYTNIYNKAGRIGIYTREERDAIIHRFRDKRKRRVWKKKIRYFCRKNLADRRIRIKGRFVKGANNNMIVNNLDGIQNELNQSMNSNDMIIDINNDEDDDDDLEYSDELNHITINNDNNNHNNNTNNNNNNNNNQQTELDDIQITDSNNNNNVTNNDLVESVKISKHITLTLNNNKSQTTSNNIYNYMNNESIDNNDVDNNNDDEDQFIESVDNQKIGVDNVASKVMKRIRRHSIAY